MPPVIELIADLVSDSTFLTASLTAAASKSSKNSFSSVNNDGSIVTFFTSCLPVITTFTIPAPDSPITSALDASSCILAIFSCIFWACFIKLLISIIASIN